MRHILYAAHTVCYNPTGGYIIKPGGPSQYKDAILQVQEFPLSK